MKFKGRAVIAFVALLQKGLVATASDGSDEDELNHQIKTTLDEVELLLLIMNRRHN